MVCAFLEPSVICVEKRVVASCNFAVSKQCPVFQVLSNPFSHHLEKGLLELGLCHVVLLLVILDFATDKDMDMIVMGSRGLGVVKGVLLGSVSQYIVEQSKCPVLVVK